MEYNNYKNSHSGNDKYGSQRLELAIYLRDNIFNKVSYDIFIENGTLLGAYRNNKFIKHDDDFDFAILIEDRKEIYDIFCKIKRNLNSKYKIRLISGYSDKLEIYDPSYGNYILAGPKYEKRDYHHVTVDLQFYLKHKNGYKSMYYISNNPLIDSNIILPLKKIGLEKQIFNCPNKTELFLKKIYGNINEGAKYNSITGLYE